MQAARRAQRGPELRPANSEHRGLCAQTPALPFLSAFCGQRMETPNQKGTVKSHSPLLGQGAAAGTLCGPPHTGDKDRKNSWQRHLRNLEKAFFFLS